MFYDPFAPAFSYFFFFYVVVGKLNWPNTGWHVLFIKIKILLRFWRSQRVILFISLMNNLMQLVFFFPSSIHFLLDFGRVFCCFMLLDSLKRDLSKSFLYCLLSNKVLCAFFVSRGMNEYDSKGVVDKFYSQLHLTKEEKNVRAKKIMEKKKNRKKMKKKKKKNAKKENKWKTAVKRENFFLCVPF